MNVRALSVVVALGCLAGGTSSASAADIPAGLTDYRITSWAGGDGITLGAVRSIAQDRDGYLWLATEAGLVRFDGFRFATADIVSGPTPLPAGPLQAVFEARDGSLWAGYGNGHGIYHIVDGQVRDVYLQNQIAGFVKVITEDRSGTLWVGHADGLHRFRDGRWEPSPLPSAEPGWTVFDVHEDRAGTLWVASASGLYRRTPGGSFEKSPQSDGMALAISEDAAGRVWTTDQTHGFRRADTADRNHLFEGRGMNVFHDRRGTLWVATVGQGLWQVRNASGDGTAPTVQRATVQTGLVSDENSDLLEDRDGNIWVGSYMGLNRLTPHHVRSLVDIGVVRAIALGPDGTAWTGTSSGLIAIDGVTALSPGKTSVVSRIAIRALHTDGRGSVWAATDTGLNQVVNRRLVPVARSGPPLDRITSMDSDRRGVLWICDEAQGVMRLVGGRLERVAVVTEGTTARPTLLHVDSEDRVWVAFERGALRALDREGHLQQYGVAEGLPHTTINAIHHDRRGELWIGGDGGLSRLGPHGFETLTSRNGLPARPAGAEPVMTLIDDDAGDLWVGLNMLGIVRVQREEISRAIGDSSYRLRYRVYGPSDGTAGMPGGFSGGNVVKGPNGALWFVLGRGVTVLDPRELRNEPSSALGQPRIEGVTADDRRYTALAGVALPPRTSRLRIDYTVISFSSLDRIRFRYRMDGFDTDWVDGTGPRQALYTNLPPGAYRFRLQAANAAAAWSDVEADWSFSIEPMFYQTRWFYLVCVLGVVMLAIATSQLRMRQVRKETALVFGERLRLSREIHDTLLQSLAAFALQLDSAVHHIVTQPTRVQGQLVTMRKQIEGYIGDVTQSIWDLRSPSLEKRGLVGELRATASQLTAGSVSFSLTVNGTPRSCPPKLETQVLRIGREAVMNAVRHAQASHVRMEIGFDDRILRLRVADDGCGFDAARIPSSGSREHYGLIGMRERAEKVGGRCTIESVPGSGVEVIAEFPLAQAG